MLLEKENGNEVQRHWRNEFGTPLPTCVTVAQLHGKFGADGTVQNVDSESATGLHAISKKYMAVLS
jgi:hypothetical protein